MAAVDDRWWTEEDEGGQPTSATKIVQEMAGKTIRLVSVHWSTARRNEYLYSPGHDYSSRRRMVLSWKEEVQGDILAKSRYLVELVPGEDDQIRLVSVNWSHLDRNEYLYSPDVDQGFSSSSRRRMVFSWKGKVQGDIRSKSRYLVELVPGEDDQIRLVSVHWSAADRNEYLYSSAIDWGGTRRMVLSWKGEVQSDILSKSRYRVEFPSP